MKLPAFLAAKPQPAGDSAAAAAPPAWGPADLPPRRHWLGWTILGAVLLFALIVIARTPGLPGAWMQEARTRPATSLLILLAIGMLGVYPVAYLAYLGFGADAQRKRLRDDFQLFGLVAEDKLDETIDKLYQHVYSWPQFVAYIVLIEFISVAVLAAFIARVTIASALSDNIILIVTFGYLGAYVFSVQE
jgi:hypothetical protein